MRTLDVHHRQGALHTGIRQKRACFRDYPKRKAPASFSGCRGPTSYLACFEYRSGVVSALAVLVGIETFAFDVLARTQPDRELDQVERDRRHGARPHQRDADGLRLDAELGAHALEG